MRNLYLVFIIFTTSVLSIFADAPRILTVQSEPDYPPFCVEDENGDSAGFSIDLFRAAAEIMGYEVRFEVAPWHLIKENLRLGLIDALPMVGRSPEREQDYDFTVPYHQLHGAVFVRKGEKKLKEPDDLNSAAILVMKGDNADEFVTRTFPSAEIIRTDTFESAFQLLHSGQADAVVAQHLMGQELIKNTNLKNIEPLDLELTGFAQDFSFAVKKGNSKLLADLNEGLVLLISNGTYERLYKKWFFRKLPDMSYTDILKAVLPVLAASLLVFFIAAVILLEYRVSSRTRALRFEVDERRKAEAEVNRQLDEKDILLREVHHRIKNNFSSIEAFITLSGENKENPEVKEALEAAARRISSMRVLYEKLLVEGCFSVMQLRDYAESLISEIARLYSENSNIRIVSEIDDIEIEADALFYVGIILNELITNSMKYAFPDHDEGLVMVTIRIEDGNLRITVKDNGIGCPDPDPCANKGFGTTIIKMLCEQKNGEYVMNSEDGVENIAVIELQPPSEET